MSSAWPYVSSEKCGGWKRDKLQLELNLLALILHVCFCDLAKLQNKQQRSDVNKCKRSSLTFVTFFQQCNQQADALQLQTPVVNEVFTLKTTFIYSHKDVTQIFLCGERLRG